MTHNINTLQLAKYRAVASAGEVLCLPLQIATHNCNHKTRGGKNNKQETQKQTTKKNRNTSTKHFVVIVLH